MGAARGTWDASKHFRGYHGRFAAGRDRSEEGGAFGRAVAAFHPPRKAGEARKQVGLRSDAAREVHAAYHARALTGSASREQRLLTEYQSPQLRNKAVAATGSPVMPATEALRRHVGMVRNSQRQKAGTLAPRIAAARTFTGRKRVIRGYTIPSGAKPLGEARRYA